MWVKILRSTVGTGGVLVVGEVKNLPDAEAHYLIGLGKAQPALAPLADAAAPVPQHGDPVVARTRGGSGKR